MRKKPGRKIVKGLFCAGVALSAVLCAPCASAKDEVVSADTKNLTVSSKVEGNVLAGGYTTDETVSGNKITIVSGAEIATYTDASGEHGGYVYGGQSTGSGAVNSNTVTINGGSVASGIRGGQSAGGAVTGNTINLNGANGIDITKAWLYGSNATATGQNNNTLNIRNFKGRAQNIGNFDRIDLDLAGLTLRAGDPIIVLTEKETTRLGNSTIHLHTAQKAIAHTNSALVPRYEVIKNKTDAGLTAENVKYEKGQITVREKGALQALYKVEWDGPGIDSVDGDSIDLVKTGETVFMEIASNTVTCSSPTLPVKQCLQVRDVYYDNSGVITGTSTWRAFYPNIEGYQHQEGVGHILRLKRYNVPNAPANTQNQAYILDMIVQ